MLWRITLTLTVVCSICQVLAKVPHKEDLCDMIVDNIVHRDCLKCFTRAGAINKHPEKVRNCAATHLPPDLAECSVPHAEKPDTIRINQGGGEYHKNHTNANFLPSCLRRRLRRLVKYQQKEETFVTQASGIMEYILSAELVQHGAPTILSVQAMASILEHSGIENLIQESISSCKNQYRRDRLQDWENSILEDTDEHELKALVGKEYDLSEYMEDDDGSRGNVEDDKSIKKPMSDPVGNNLPFGGTNNFARRVLLYKCISSSLFNNEVGQHLLHTVMHEDFFYPIPQWWVQPLLMIAKKKAFK